MPGAVSLRVRGALRAVTGLEGLVVGLIPRSSLAIGDPCIGSSFEVGASSVIDDPGASSNVGSAAAR